MHVIATAGHVDHGKSTLVRALTGTDPDRLAEEHRRGLSIQLGYCWTSLPEVGDVAFVDVPGHERFIATTLSGVGPVPAVLFVVAADDPWMPQAAEHLAALDALGVSHGILVVTRADLADPEPALARARGELAGTTLADIPAVAVSGRTGMGLDRLRSALVDLVQALPEPDEDADVRLWVDRCFHMKGAGTVVTGTLPTGRVSVGDTLVAVGAGTDQLPVRVRAVQALGRPVDSVTGVARVALNVSGADVEELGRSSVLLTPDAWCCTEQVDLRVHVPGGGKNPRVDGENPTTQRGIWDGSTGRGGAGRGVSEAAESRAETAVPERPMLHIGATAVEVRFRPLSGGHGRLSLSRPLPLRIGDRALLRDPGSRRVWGVTVLDPAPRPLRRRGAAAALGEELARLDSAADLAREVARRGIVRLSLLRRLGVRIVDADTVGLRAGDWIVAPAEVERLRARMVDMVRTHDDRHPLERGIPVATLAQQLGLPTQDLVPHLVAPPFSIVAGRVTGERSVVLPEGLEKAIAALHEDLASEPFAAPTADRLRELGLDAKALAAAARAGRLLRVGDGIVLLPGADQMALARLAELPQPFTTSEARVRLGTSRRVVLPLLGHLDRRGGTERLPDDRRRVRATPGGTSTGG